MDREIRRSLSWPLVLAFAGLSLFVFACGSGGDVSQRGGHGGETTAIQGEELPTIELPSLWDWGIAERLGTLTGSADVVFKGNVVALKGQRAALSRAGGVELGAPAPRWADFPISQFEVRVESVASGNLTPGGAVTFEQAGGVQTRHDGTRVRLMLEGDHPIQVGATYLFFGSVQEDGSIEAPPFGRMEVQADGSLAAEASWAHLGALAQLSRMRVGDAEREVSAAADE